MHFKQLCLAAAAALGILGSNAALAEGELSGVTLFVCVEPLNPPFAFMTDDWTKPEGIDVDIIYELQKRLGFSLKDDRIYTMMRDDQFDRIKDGTADIIAGGILVTKAREEFIEFIRGYYDSGFAIVTSSVYRPEIKTLADLSGKRVLVSKGGAAHAYISKAAPQAVAVPISNLSLGFVQVAQGQADALIDAYPMCTYYVETMPVWQLQHSERLSDENTRSYGIGLKPDSNYNHYIQREFNAMRTDGTLQQILEKWQ